MYDIFKKLYLGEINPCDKRIKKDSEREEALQKLTAMQSSITEQMFDLEKARFIEYQELYTEMHSDADVENFVEGFRLGVQLMIAVMNG